MVKKKITKKSEIKLTKKQKIFADNYMDTGNASQSAFKAYDCNKETARKIGSENLTKLDIQAYIESMAEEAQSVIYEVMKGKKTPSNVKITAAKDIMDRAGYKPVEKKEIELKGLGELLAEMIDE